MSEKVKKLIPDNFISAYNHIQSSVMAFHWNMINQLKRMNGSCSSSVFINEMLIKKVFDFPISVSLSFSNTVSTPIYTN